MQRSRQRLRRPDGIPRVKGRRSRGERHTASGGRRNVADADGDVRNRSGTSVTGSPTAPNRVSPIQRPSDVSGDRGLRRLHRRKRKSKRAALPNRRTLPPLAEYLCGDRPGCFAESVRALPPCHEPLRGQLLWTSRGHDALQGPRCGEHVRGRSARITERSVPDAAVELSGRDRCRLFSPAGQGAGKERQGSRSQVAGPSPTVLLRRFLRTVGTADPGQRPIAGGRPKQQGGKTERKGVRLPATAKQ